MFPANRTLIAETVFGRVSEDEEDDEEYADDDVRDDEEKTIVEVEDTEDEAQDGDNDDESTKSGWKRANDSGNDDDNDDQSARNSGDESTKADLDNLKDKGRKVREDPIREGEVERLQAAHKQDTMTMIEQMRREFERKIRDMEAKMPGVAEGADTRVDDSGEGPGGNASAEPG